MIDYQLIYSDKRKTIALQIKHGKLIVRAPSYVPESKVHEFILKKRQWINEKVNLSIGHSKIPLFSYQQGEQLFIKGINKSFIVKLATSKSVTETSCKIIVTHPQYNDNLALLKNDLTEQLEQWFCQQVNEYLKHRLTFYVERMLLKPASVKVKKYKSRWGSCNSRQQLTFNSLLAMVPSDVFDYVIVHELSHLKHMNHSAAFWQLVASQLPNYQEQKQWLKKYTSVLNIG